MLCLGLGYFFFVLTLQKKKKDVFEAFYKKDLAKRLLLSRSVSPEWEQLMIKNLKNECGSVYTTKMEGMFKGFEIEDVIFVWCLIKIFLDMEQSKALMSEFGTSKKGAQCPLQLSLNVLTAGYCKFSALSLLFLFLKKKKKKKKKKIEGPTYVLQPVTLPPIFVQTCQIFEQFYGQKHEVGSLFFYFVCLFLTKCTKVSSFVLASLACICYSWCSLSKGWNFVLRFFFLFG